MLKVYLTKPITLIINQMLNTGIFPDKLKIAKIKPIYKLRSAKSFNWSATGLNIRSSFV